MEEQNFAGNQVTADQTMPESSPEQVSNPPERTFTQDQVNELMKKRVARSHSSFFNRYGVKDLKELDNLFGQATGYGPLKEKYDELDKNHNDLVASNKDLTKKYGYLKCNIDESKINDIETYFKGKGIDIDENSLVAELKSHPEWAKKVATITSIGAESTPQQDQDERALI